MEELKLKLKLENSHSIALGLLPSPSLPCLVGIGVLRTASHCHHFDFFISANKPSQHIRTTYISGSNNRFLFLFLFFSYVQ